MVALCVSEAAERVRALRSQSCSGSSAGKVLVAFPGHAEPPEHSTASPAETIRATSPEPPEVGVGGQGKDTLSSGATLWPSIASVEICKFGDCFADLRHKLCQMMCIIVPAIGVSSGMFCYAYCR